MSGTTTWGVIVAIGILSLGLRGAFLLLPSLSEHLPSWTQEVLTLVPAAAFGSLVAPHLLLDDGQLRLWAPGPLAAFLALVIGVRTRSLLATMAVGLVTYAVLDLLVF